MCTDGYCEHNVAPLPESADPAASGLSRRGVLTVGAATAALTLGPMTFAHAADSAGSAGTAGGSGTPADGTQVTQTLTGHLDTGVADFVYLPVVIPAGVKQIDVSYSYDHPAVTPGDKTNSCDIGVFDERGIALGGPGFRGWSGGFRTAFSISAGDATPGYLPGPVVGVLTGLVGAHGGPLRRY